MQIPAKLKSVIQLPLKEVDGDYPAPKTGFRATASSLRSGLCGAIPHGQRKYVS